MFDELAADGKPLSFTFTTYSLVEARAAAETLQAQLSAFDNVEVKVETLDFAAAQTRVNSRDFDMTISSANIQDPDGPLWSAFHSSSQGNTSASTTAGSTPHSRRDVSASRSKSVRPRTTTFSGG